MLRDRPLSVIRVTGDQAPFMQKNLPKYMPDWIGRASLWAEASHRTVDYALCNDPARCCWFANQRAVEYDPTLGRAEHLDRPTHMVLDLDPPQGDGSPAAVAAARFVGEVLDQGRARRRGQDERGQGPARLRVRSADVGVEDAAAVTRAIARRAERLDPELATTAFLKEDRGGKVFLDATRSGGATVVAAYSPWARPGVPVSLPVAWADLDDVCPADFAVHERRRAA